MTRTVIFRDRVGTAPLVAWMEHLDVRSRTKVARTIELHLRVLYFFDSNDIVLSHGFAKEGKVPDAEIERARRHRAAFVSDRQAHTL